MYRERFETGFFRLYQAGWGLLVAAMVAIAVMEGHRAPAEAAGMVLSAIIGPWLLMRLGRWVYRGFVPKD